jgi:type II secretory pathway component GspD/PulD (secretin)
MKRRSKIVAPVLLLCVFFWSALNSPAAAQQVPPVRTTPSGILLNFQDVDLAFAMSALAQAAGINMVYTDLPQKPVTLRTMQPVSTGEVVGLIRNLAVANGVSVIQEPGFMRLQGMGTPTTEDPRHLFIHRLQHARAPVLAATLQALFGGAVRMPTTAAAAAAGTLSQQLRQMEMQSAQAAVRQPTPTIITTQQAQAGGIQGAVQIIPDEVTNSLLVRASPADWQIIEQAINSLDLRPLQVLIEVVIAEVRRSDELNVGLSIGATDTLAGRSRTFTGRLRDEGTPDNFALRLVRHGTVDFEATLAALASTGQVRILSRPVVLAQNNQQANIMVGSQRPFIQVSRSLPTDVGRDQVVQYRNVGTSLTIIPTINADGYVNLAVRQEVSNATTETQFGAPVISTREATTQLLARHGQTVVLGGLVDQQEDRIRTGIPFLKDLPLLGYLFGTTRSVRGNSELFLFLTPHIVANDEDADRIREGIEGQAGLLRELVPVTPIIPPVLRDQQDTLPGLRQDTLQEVRQDTLPVNLPDALRGMTADSVLGRRLQDILRMMQADTTGRVRADSIRRIRRDTLPGPS